MSKSDRSTPRPVSPLVIAPPCAARGGPSPLATVGAVSSLIHLNGPPGIGKSTLAALYADRNSGTLNLDIDSLHPLIGGWRAPDSQTHQLLRPVALAMASTHLAGGRDVVLPQYLGRIEEIERFERVARECGARFREIVLLDDRAPSIARFDSRQDDSDWGQHNRQVVAAQGGPAFLAAMYDRLVEVLRLRPAALVIRSAPGAIEETYAALVAALSPVESEEP
jgi:predicted kinase